MWWKLKGQLGSSPRSLRVVSMATCCLCSSWSLRPYWHPIRQYTRNQHCHSTNCHGSPPVPICPHYTEGIRKQREKTHQVFSAHISPQKFENKTFSTNLDLCLGQKNHVITVRSSFSISSFYKMLSACTKTFFKPVLWSEERFSQVV